MEARRKEYRREHIYRIFVTDGISAMCGTKERYYDIIEDRKVETRTGDEIIEAIGDRLETMGR